MTVRPLTLLSNASATGSAVRWPGGRGTFMADGTFASATITLSVLGPDGSSYIAVGTDTTLTAEGCGNFDLPPCKLKAVVSGGSPSALYATVEKIGEA